MSALLLTLSITSKNAVKILEFFPVPSISYQVVFQPLTREVAKRGHEITIITPDPTFSCGVTPAKLTEIDSHEMSYKKWRTLYEVTSTGNNDKNLKMHIVFYMMLEVTKIKLF